MTMLAVFSDIYIILIVHCGHVKFRPFTKSYVPSRHLQILLLLLLTQILSLHHHYHYHCYYCYY